MDDGALSVLIPGTPMMQLWFVGNWGFLQQVCPFFYGEELAITQHISILVISHVSSSVTVSDHLHYV